MYWKRQRQCQIKIALIFHSKFHISWNSACSIALNSQLKWPRWLNQIMWYKNKLTEYLGIKLYAIPRIVCLEHIQHLTNEAKRKELTLH